MKTQVKLVTTSEKHHTATKNEKKMGLFIFVGM